MFRDVLRMCPVVMASVAAHLGDDPCWRYGVHWQSLHRWNMSRLDHSHTKKIHAAAQTATTRFIAGIPDHSALDGIPQFATLLY